MQYVVLAQHNADVCPLSNAKVRKQIQGVAGRMGQLQTKHGVKISNGPLILGASHKMVVVLDAPNVEAVREFCVDGGLAQWNDVEMYPAWTMEEALKRAASLEPIF